ncbi:putative RNA methyltransferase [Micromonospora matsumotoense]|uniref:putative RNA methyltransferase n=1 Tax=Micromonospora matsumotoense TaxID=121616 RepID=UPI003F54081E
MVARLRCPVCAQPLAAATDTRALRCPRRHSFDLARRGYVNLLTGRAPHVGDTAEMVAARADFLAAGHYDVISSALAEAASSALAAPHGPTQATEPTETSGPTATTGSTETTGPAETTELAQAGEPAEPTGAAQAGEPAGTTEPAQAGEPAETARAAQVGGPVEANGSAGRQAEPGFGAYPLVVDAGAGTGWHLAAVLAALPDAVGLALDVAKPALRRAARAHPRAAAALADTWQQLPLADRSVAVLLNVFAPRNGVEFHRVLHPAGALLVVTPTDAHLAELVDVLGLLRVDPAKADRVADSLAGQFTPGRTAVHTARLTLGRAEVATLVGMGPSAWHTDPTRLAAAIDALPAPVTVTASVRLTAWRPR